MGDTEFEEFRQYFDRLPQYIKAPAHCYTLVHDVDLEDDSPVKDKSSSHPNTINYQKSLASLLLNGSQLASSSDDPLAANENVDEPFAGDLGVVPEKEASPMVTRKRRKLPELPKNAAKRWNEEPRQMSLAQEIREAEKYSYSCNNSSCCNVSSASTPRGPTHKYHNTVPTTTRNNLHLKFHKSNIDDESSPDSEKYPSLDSGHSTVHSEDGSKIYSPQIPSLNESMSPISPTNSISGIPFSHLEILEATHRGLHKFCPRHHDEIEIDIGDPIYMQKEDEDMWCEGVNLRTGMQGIFPSAYVVDVDYNDFDPNETQVKKERYLISYVGSIETMYHKGNDVLCQAVKKIASHENYVASHTRPCILEISDQGLRMVDKGKPAPNQPPCHDYFYALKNVSFCGFHPQDHRYFGFVTKHPTLNRFACHVFFSEESTRPIAESVGRAFQRFYQKFLETAYPIEDIYLE